MIFNLTDDWEWEFFLKISLSLSLSHSLKFEESVVVLGIPVSVSHVILFTVV